MSTASRVEAETKTNNKPWGGMYCSTGCGCGEVKKKRDFKGGRDGRKKLVVKKPPLSRPNIAPNRQWGVVGPVDGSEIVTPLIATPLVWGGNQVGELLWKKGF